MDKAAFEKVKRKISEIHVHMMGVKGEKLYPLIEGFASISKIPPLSTTMVPIV